MTEQEFTAEVTKYAQRFNSLWPYIGRLGFPLLIQTPRGRFEVYVHPMSVLVPHQGGLGVVEQTCVSGAVILHKVFGDLGLQLVRGVLTDRLALLLGSPDAEEQARGRLPDHHLAAAAE